MTDEELDAPDEVYDTMMEVQRNPTGAWQAIHDQADTITTLRAQLAVAEACNRGLMRLNEATQARADRAEAALAAQIEADAEIVESFNPCAATAIRNQPHDRTALDRHDAKTREKALREAAKTAHECNMAGDPQASSTYILALIEVKP